MSYEANYKVYGLKEQEEGYDKIGGESWANTNPSLTEKELSFILRFLNTKDAVESDLYPWIRQKFPNKYDKYFGIGLKKEIEQDLRNLTASRLATPDQSKIDTNPKDLMGSKKAPLSLVTYECVKGISEAMYYGAFESKRKDGKTGYGPYNWRQTQVRLSIYLDATLRHTFALANGEDKDPDSGLPHEYHIAANMNVILDARKHGALIDDRLEKRER